jgi:DNA-directed RNA polymerase II subunit RPB2
MGPTFYQRFKHMVSDKINYRSEGPRTLMTHQPLEGRAQDGGLRIGEMERDALLSHGISSFIQESMMKRSDEHNFIFQKETGLLDYTSEFPLGSLNIPYCAGLFVHEMESMHLQVKLLQ